MPLRGRDSLGRIATTSVSTCTVSPTNSGAGKRTASRPRFATVVPSVVSLIEMPTMSPSVKKLFMSGLPNSDCVRMYSWSMCSGAGLCVNVLNSTLSVSVTVRRIACSNTRPTSNSSK